MFEPRPSQEFYVIQRTALSRKYSVLPALCCFRDQQGDNTIYYCKLKCNDGGKRTALFQSERGDSKYMFATKEEAQREADRINLAMASMSIIAKCITPCTDIRVGEQYIVDTVIQTTGMYCISLIGKLGFHNVEHFELYENDVLIDVKSDLRFQYA